MDRIRDALAEVDRSMARLDGMKEVELNLKREADRLVGLAKDFRARAAELKGPALHELLKPWIERASFDKETRVLDLTIRQVPRFDLEGATAPEEQLQPDLHAVRAQVTFPALERDAWGRYRTPSYKIPVVLTIQTPHGERVERRSVDKYIDSHDA